MKKGAFSLGLLSVVLAMAALAPAGETASIGKKIDNFSARDFRGKLVSLDDFASSKLVVVAFMGVECPLAKLYGPRLGDLAREFQDRGVAVLVVDSNQQDSITELAHYAREYRVDCPLLKDAGNLIADRFGAIRTPEMFVLDADRVIRYWGRVDDQFGFQGKGIAYQRPAPKRRDLAIAIEELLADKEVSEPLTLSQGCHIGRVKKPIADADVTYTKQVAAILNKNCVFCHRPGQIAPFPLTCYDEAVGWAEMARQVVNEQRMPPWHADPKIGRFSNDARLSSEEKELLNRWVDAGAPQGDPQDLPPAPRFTEGWQIPQPEQVLYMADKPFEVPANGTVEYQRFHVDPGWTEDKWISALQCVPGNPAVVHHIIVHQVPAGVTPTGQAGRLRSNWLGAYAPGLRQEPLPEGYARFVPKGTKLMFEMHYTANGSVQSDRSYVGFVFADAKKVKKEVAVQNAGNFTFKIPPGDANYPVEADYTFRQNALILSLAPHLHVRGKSFSYDLIFPDGKSESLLSVPNYDFGWQTTYQLAEARYAPRGSKLHCVARFDNSADNLANPDPTKEVGFGEQTWEEMMFGWFEMALADQDLTQPAAATALRVKEFLAQADSVRLDDQVQAMARQAMQSDKDFEYLGYQLLDLVPQLDRVCVTSVDNDKLRLRMLHERPGLRTALRSRSTMVRAAGQSLASYAAGTATAVNQQMGGAAGSVMVNMAAKDIRSSMHVPVVVDGVHCTVNFWSAEEGAFPPEAVRLLEQVAHLMTDGAKLATK